MAEADAERRDAGLREAADGLERDSRLVRRARAGRDDHAVVPADEQLLDGAWLLRTTSSSAPSSPRYWTRL